MTNALQAELYSETFHVWSDNTVTVDIIDKHLRISPLRSVTAPEQLNREEVLATWETSKKIASILEQVFGTRHFLEYSPIHYDGRQLYTEIVPVSGTSKFVDLAAKMRRSIYVISGGIHDHCQLTDVQIRNIQSVAEGIFNRPPVVPGLRDDNPGNWEIPWKNIHLAKTIVGHTLAINDNPQLTASTDSENSKNVTSKVAGIEGEFDADRVDDKLIRKVESCAFCRQQVIDNQRIIEGKWHHLVFNNKPFISEKHLMTVSKAHCLSREHLTTDEVWEEHLLFVKAGKVFQSMFGEEIPYCRFTQNGFYAGQTVPHPHTHFLAGTGKEGLNFWLKTVLKELEGNREPPLNPDQLSPIIEAYRNALDKIQYVRQIPQSAFRFDVKKVVQTYQTYHENHPGLTLVIGHPFEGKKFLGGILEEQRLIREIFEKHELGQALILYEPEQIHATIIELASQHDESQVEQETLSTQELSVSTKGTDIDINFAAEWIRKRTPFEVELGQGVLTEEHKDQTIRITPNGQIVMKGRAKERDLLAGIRSEFEGRSNIVHKYGATDDEFFFVIGYLKPSHGLNNPDFIHDLLSHLESRREVIQLSMKVTGVSVILYQQRTLTPSKCLEQWKFQLNQAPSIANLFEEVTKVNAQIFSRT